MALTLAADSSYMPVVVGASRSWRGTVTFDDSYPTGGEAIAASDFGFGLQIDHVVVHSTNTAQYRAVWDAANSKLKVFLEDATSGKEAEVADTTDISTVAVEVVAYGI